MPVLVGKQRRVAVQEIRARSLVPEVAEEETSNARAGRSDPPVAERRHARSKSGSTVSIVVAKAVEADEGPERGRQGTARSRRTDPRSRPHPGGRRRRNRSRRARSAASIDQLPAAHEEVEPGSEVTLVVGKRAVALRRRRRRMRVVVLSGGRSSEHEVSLRSGAAIAAGLRDAGHEMVEVTIGRDGRWTMPGGAGRAGPGRRPARRRRRLPRPARARSARTAASRACSSGSTCPTSAPTCSARRSAWTS